MDRRSRSVIHITPCGWFAVRFDFLFPENSEAQSQCELHTLGEFRERLDFLVTC